MAQHQGCLLALGGAERAIANRSGQRGRLILSWDAGHGRDLPCPVKALPGEFSTGKGCLIYGHRKASAGRSPVDTTSERFARSPCCAQMELPGGARRASAWSSRVRIQLHPSRTRLRITAMNREDPELFGGTEATELRHVPLAMKVMDEGVTTPR